MSSHLLAIDQGTTSTRAILFRQDLTIAAIAQQEFNQHYPKSGWVEHDAEEIFDTVLSTCREAMSKADVTAADIASIGITNQRETVVVWDKNTGVPIHNAIVWQDRRTVTHCNELRDAGHEQLVTERTGLLLDPYFSGTKVKWLLDQVDGARSLAEVGNLLFGTIDTWLIWKLTNGAVHATDATNASRTMLFNIHTNQWDEELLKLLDVPSGILPEVKDSADDFGKTDPSLFDGAIRICGVAGDQQAATIGQACFAPGMMKSTYGTGCFAMLNTGKQAVKSNNRLLTTIAYRLNGETTYALEGSIFIAGAAVQWLRDGLKIIDSAPQTQDLAEAADGNQDVYLVPAFVGMGAPYWDADARGAVYGLTRNTGPAELARAALESVGYQTRDLLEAMQGDWNALSDTETVLRVDGGMSASDWAMSFLSDILGLQVDRPQILETTALGVAYLAGWHANVCPDPDSFAQSWALERRFEPQLNAAVRDTKYDGWRDAVRRTLSSSQ